MTAATTPALPYSNIIKVRFSDVDAQGHLYFANYLVYADEILAFYMEELGYSGMNPLEAPCFIFTVNIHCDYIDEVTASDDVRVCVGYSRLGNSSADACFELYNNASDVLLARGGLTQVYVDKDTRKSTPIPPDFKAAIIARQPELGEGS